MLMQQGLLKRQCLHAGNTGASPPATFTPSCMRPGQWAPLPFRRQTRQTQQPLVPSHHALLHTRAGVASIPADTQPEPQTSAVSATTEPQGGEQRQSVRLQQHSAGSQGGSQGGLEADRASGAQAVEGHRVVLYKGRYMLAFRMLVRFKIFQLVGIAALAIPINTFLAGVSLFNCCPPPPLGGPSPPVPFSEALQLIFVFVHSFNEPAVTPYQLMVTYMYD